VSDGRAPANTIEVRYMLVGDVNPDRSVDGGDAVTVTRNYMVAGKSAWDQGTLISNRRHPSGFARQAAGKSASRLS